MISRIVALICKGKTYEKECCKKQQDKRHGEVLNEIMEQSEKIRREL